MVHQERNENTREALVWRPFCLLLQLLQRILSRDRQGSQGDLHGFMMGPAIDVSINRNYIYQDAFEKLGQDKGIT